MFPFSCKIKKLPAASAYQFAQRPTSILNPFALFWTLFTQTIHMRCCRCHYRCCCRYHCSSTAPWAQFAQGHELNKFMQLKKKINKFLGLSSDVFFLLQMCWPWQLPCEPWLVPHVELALRSGARCRRLCQNPLLLHPKISNFSIKGHCKSFVPQAQAARRKAAWSTKAEEVKKLRKWRRFWNNCGWWKESWGWRRREGLRSCPAPWEMDFHGMPGSKKGLIKVLIN